MNYNIPRNKQASHSKYFKKLFEETYWSGHSPFDETTEKELCFNRDLMAEQYNLKKFHYYHSGFPKKYWRGFIIADLMDVERRMSICFIKENGEPHYQKKSYTNRKMREWVEDYANIMKHKDHTEYYTDNDNNIVSVFSKYIRDNNIEILELIEKSGYKQINPIYSTDQKTFIKVINLNNQ